MRWEGTVLYCNCRDAIPARCLTVARKSSPNIGRKFWGCRRYDPKFPHRACNLFLWDQDVQEARREDSDSQRVRVSSMTTELRRLRIDVDDASLSADADINAESDAEEPAATGARIRRARVASSERFCGGYTSDGSVFSADVEAEMARLADKAAAGLKRSRNDTDDHDQDHDVTSGKKRKVAAAARTARARSPESPTAVRRSTRPRKAPIPPGNSLVPGNTNTLSGAAITTPRKRTAAQSSAAANGLLTPQNTRTEPPRQSSKRGALAAASFSAVEPESPTRRRSGGDGKGNETIRNRRISDFFVSTKAPWQPPQQPQQRGMASKGQQAKHHDAAVMADADDVDTPMAGAVAADDAANTASDFFKPPAASTRSKTSAAAPGTKSGFFKSASFSSTATTVIGSYSICPGAITTTPTPKTSFSTSFGSNVNTSFADTSFASTNTSFAKDSRYRTLVDEVMACLTQQHPIDHDALRRALHERDVEYRKVLVGRDSTRTSLKLTKARLQTLANEVADLQRENRALKAENLALKGNLSSANGASWSRWREVE